MSKFILSDRLPIIPSLIASGFLFYVERLTYEVFWPLRAVLFCFAMYVSYTAYKWNKLWPHVIWYHCLPLALCWFTRNMENYDAACTVLFLMSGIVLKNQIKIKLSHKIAGTWWFFFHSGILAVLFFSDLYNQFTSFITTMVRICAYICRSWRKSRVGWWWMGRCWTVS